LRNFYLQTATFQMILASDYRYYQSYVIYNYNRFNFWSQYRSNGQGYQANPSFFRNMYTSGSPSAIQLPAIVGERGAC